MTKRRILTQDLGYNHGLRGAERQRLIIQTDLTNVRTDLEEKIHSCLAENEPFGMGNDESTVIYIPDKLTAAWFAKDLTKTVHTCEDLPHFLALIASMLLTHDFFLGPLMVHRFITAVKVIQDESQNAEPAFPHQALFDAVKPSGSLDGCDGGIQEGTT